MSDTDDSQKIQPYGWIDLYSMYGQESAGVSFPAPPSRKITPEQRLLLRLIIDVLEEYQKHRQPKDRRWLIEDAVFLCNYLPDRVVTKAKLIRAVEQLDAGETFSFKLSE